MEWGWVLLLSSHTGPATRSWPQTEHFEGQPKEKSGNGWEGRENGRTSGNISKHIWNGKSSSNQMEL